MEKHICQECGKKYATRKMQVICNGVESDVYLCEDCSRKFNLFPPLSSGFEDFMFNFANNLGFFEGHANKSQKCPKCGYTLDEYLKTGYLGCPDCYKAFESAVSQMAKKMQKGTIHKGKTPSDNTTPEERKYRELLKAKEAAVQSEDYERAAEINEQIKKLKGEG